MLLAYVPVLCHHSLIASPWIPHNTADLPRLLVYKNKTKVGTIDRVQDKNTVIGHSMFKKETNWDLFLGMEIITERGEVGRCEGPFGKSGKFKVYFPTGTEAIAKDKLILNFKKYIFDPTKKMVQGKRK